jgi:hypothetical protein
MVEHIRTEYEGGPAGQELEYALRTLLGHADLQGVKFDDLMSKTSKDVLLEMLDKYPNPKGILNTLMDLRRRSTSAGFKGFTQPTPTWDLTDPKIKEMVEQGFPLGALLAGVLGYGAYQNQNQPALEQGILGM